MANPFWNYFLAIEADLAAMARYVEFHRDNFKTYSVEFSRILLAAASEVDVLCKRLCTGHSLSNRPNIDDYRTVILAAYPKLPNAKVLVRRYQLEVEPWEDWGLPGPVGPRNPVWWQSYNAVKHRRDSSFAKASLENALGAVAGLFVIVLYVIRSESGSPEVEPLPKLLGMKREPGYIQLEDCYELPDPIADEAAS